MNSWRNPQRRGKVTFEELQHTSCRRLNNNLQENLQHKLHLFQSHYKSQEKLLRRQTSFLREQQAEYQHRLRTCSLCNGYRRSSPESGSASYLVESWSCASSSEGDPGSSAGRPTSGSTCTSASDDTCRFCSTTHLVLADCVNLTQSPRERESPTSGQEDEVMPGCKDILNYYNKLIDRGHTKIPC